MRIVYKDYAYPFRHWLTSLALGPLIIFIYALLFEPDYKFNSDMPGMYMLYVAFGLFFSLPVFIVYLLLFNLLIRMAKSMLLIKMALNLVTIIGVFMTIKLMGFSEVTLSLPLIYSIAIIASSFFYKIKKENTAND
jgi:Sec-independent protein secretion pathway component TatC